MRDFWISKSIALLIPLAIFGIGSVYFAGDQTGFWTMLVLATIWFGHVHNLISFKYQVRAVLRRKKVKEMVVFAALLAASAGLVLYFIAIGKEAVLVPCVFLVFFLHSYLNEQTILRFQAAIDIPIVYFLFLTFVPMGLLFAAMTHPSLFFDAQLVFFDLSAQARLQYIEQQLGVPSYKIAVLCMGLAAVSLWLSFRAIVGFFALKIVSSLILVSSVLILLFVQPVHYLFIFSVSFMYHYILWSVVYFQKFNNESPERLRPYIYEHVYLIVPLCFFLVGFYQEGVWWHEMSTWVFDLRVFFVTAFAHTVISFINEPWFKKYLE